jgi:hypothetical protein
MTLNHRVLLSVMVLWTIAACSESPPASHPFCTQVSTGMAMDEVRRLAVQHADLRVYLPGTCDSNTSTCTVFVEPVSEETVVCRIRHDNNQVLEVLGPPRRQ